MGLSKNREIFKTPELVPQITSTKGKNLYGVDLAFNGEETQHATHNLHTYVAAINPPLARKLIDTYIPQNESVLDPFCGGGGVLVEAILSGRDSAGGEINPLGLLLSKAKTTHIDEKISRPVFEEIITKASKYYSHGKYEPESMHKNTAFWFKEKQIAEILSFSQAINELELDSDLKTLVQVVFSAAIRDVMLTYRGEVRLRKLRGGDYDKFNPNTFEAFARRQENAIGRVSELPTGARSDIDVRDVRNQPFKENQFHSIVCSPPYADDKNGVGYFQFSKNMLSILGLTPEEIKERRSLFLGVTTKDKKPPKSESLELSLENIMKVKPEKYSEAVAFYDDYAKGLDEMVRVVKDKIIIVIGNRVLGRTQFDNALITIDVMRNSGVELEHHYTRELKKKRIPNLGDDGGGINLEHILVFKK
jgi:DNA modification methylase